MPCGGEVSARSPPVAEPAQRPCRSPLECQPRSGNCASSNFELQGSAYVVSALKDIYKVSTNSSDPSSFLSSSAARSHSGHSHLLGCLLAALCALRTTLRLCVMRLTSLHLRRLVTVENVLLHPRRPCLSVSHCLRLLLRTTLVPLRLILQQLGRVRLARFSLRPQLLGLLHRHHSHHRHRLRLPLNSMLCSTR